MLSIEKNISCDSFNTSPSLTELSSTEIAAVCGGWNWKGGFPGNTLRAMQNHGRHIWVLGLSASFVGASAKCFGEWLGYYLPYGDNETRAGYLWNGTRKFIIYFTSDVLSNAMWFGISFAILGRVADDRHPHYHEA